MNITTFLNLPQVTIFIIDEPPVNGPETEIAQIAFKPGDKVTIRAGGCCQTGGSGKSWKRYVNPSGPDSNTKYHGLIKLPGMSLTRVKDFINNVKVFTIPSGVPDMTLHLGYEDSDFQDNGYWGHDDGTEDQCKNVGNAWLEIIAVHPPKHP